jgi:D-alanyl-D-alanine dipeptidase
MMRREKLCLVILAILLLFTSCVSNKEPETLSGSDIASGATSTAETTPTPATASPSEPVSEPSPDTEPAVEPDSEQYSLPDGFVYITDVIPTALLEIRYFSEDNFVGAVIDGYEAPKAILTREAAQALKTAADKLYGQGYYIKIFDAYRPQRAVNHFVRWAEDLDDTKMKEKYYPDLDKSVLFKLGYIAERSGHSRGSTVDLTLIDISTGEELDMGSGFDFFGEISNHGTSLITPEQEKNRNILRDAMVDAGFEVYPEEWWHYKLKDEPYPDTYFDFPVR